MINIIERIHNIAFTDLSVAADQYYIYNAIEISGPVMDTPNIMESLK